MGVFIAKFGEWKLNENLPHENFHLYSILNPWRLFPHLITFISNVKYALCIISMIFFCSTQQVDVLQLFKQSYQQWVLVHWKLEKIPIKELLR
jgi:hypothetical protein